MKQPKFRRDFLADHTQLQGFLYLGADLGAVALGALLSFRFASGAAVMPVGYEVAILLSFLLAIIFFNWGGLYVSWRGRSVFDQVRDITLAWSGVIMSLIIVAFLLRVDDQFKRDWVLIWAALTWGILIIARTSVTLGLRYLRRRGWNHKRLLIVGTGNWAEQVMHRIGESDWTGLDLVAIVDDAESDTDDRVHGIPVIRNYQKLPALVSDLAIDEVWICLPYRSTDSDYDDRIQQVVHVLRHSTVTQRLVPNFAEARYLNKPITEILGLPAVNLNTSPILGVNRLVKEVEDKILASLILVLISPIMLLIVTGIKLTSPGPILFKQMRHGWDGRPIRIYKFRTMVVHAELENSVTQASREDSRITWFGSFLRKTSLDELPQFYNVLQGRMSIVGPRPHAISHNEYYMDQIDSYMQRHKVKPGITGWAQINGLRGETRTLDKMKKRVEYDLYYIDNWSIWFDIKIILLTLFKGFISKNAY